MSKSISNSMSAFFYRLYEFFLKCFNHNRLGGEYGLFVQKNGSNQEIDISSIYFNVNNTNIDAIRFDSYLALTLAVVSMVVLFVVFAWFIRWIFKVCSNSILLR